MKYIIQYNHNWPKCNNICAWKFYFYLYKILQSNSWNTHISYENITFSKHNFKHISHHVITWTYGYYLVVYVCTPHALHWIFWRGIAPHNSLINSDLSRLHNSITHFRFTYKTPDIQLCLREILANRHAQNLHSNVLSTEKKHNITQLFVP